MYFHASMAGMSSFAYASSILQIALMTDAPNGTSVLHGMLDVHADLSCSYRFLPVNSGLVASMSCVSSLSCAFGDLPEMTAFISASTAKSPSTAADVSPNLFRLLRVSKTSLLRSATRLITSLAYAEPLTFRRASSAKKQRGCCKGRCNKCSIGVLRRVLFDCRLCTVFVDQASAFAPSHCNNRLVTMLINNMKFVSTSAGR